MALQTSPRALSAPALRRGQSGHTTGAVDKATRKRPKRAPFDESARFVERLRNHDPAAFTELAEHFRDRIYSLALRITRNPDDAEDVLQEALLLAFVNIASFEGRSRLSTWLHVIACNAALSRRRKRSFQDVPYEEDNAGSGPGKGLFRNPGARFNAEPENPMLMRELQERLDAAIDALPPIYREMFILKEEQFVSIKDIAEAFGINPGAVKTRVHRARLMLRAQLSDYWQPES